MGLYYFARCELDTERRVLKVADIPRDVEPLVFDMLTLFLNRGDAVVSRDELVDVLWNGRVISDSAISVRINAARKAVGDNGKDQVIIKTVHRKGFKLAVPVTQASSKVSHLSDKNVGMANAVLAEPEEAKPVLAIAPFQCLSPEANELYLSQGLADDIATELSRFHIINVISTYSSFQLESSQSDTNTFMQSLGATHLVSGNYQQQGSSFRLKISLNELRNNHYIWSERYDFDVSELIDVRDNVVSTVVGNLFSQLHQHQMAASRKKPANNLNAYECLLRGLNLYKVGDVSLEDSKQALYWFDKTLEHDPQSARAMAWRECCAFDFQPNPPPDEHVSAAMKNLQLALSIDPGDHEVHRIVGALNLSYGNHELGDYHLAKSAELNPNDSRILLRIGFYRSFLGDRKNDLGYIERAFERNPLRPDYYWFNRGVALFAHRNYEEALKCLLLEQGGNDINHIYRAACYAAMGELTDARNTLVSLQKNNPAITLSWVSTTHPFYVYQKKEDLQHLLSLLGEGGLVG